jgi:dephospho-CoA kinase
MRSGVFAVAGAIGSGKTSVAGVIREATGAPVVSFSRALRDLAVVRRLAPTRETLQSLGPELVEREPHEFCYSVLRQANWTDGDLVIDGLRHASIREILKSIVAPVRLWTIYVDASFPTRRGRVLAESGEDVLGLWESQASEKFLTELRGSADVVFINNSGTFTKLRDEIHRWLNG